MTKTPEDLTEGKSFYCSIGKDETVKILTAKIDEYGKMCLEDGFWLYDVEDVKILASVPTYDEYKAMQLRIENGESAIDTNKRLCKKIEEMKAELAEHRHYCCCAENEVMRLKLAELEEKNAELKKWCEEFNALNVAQENKELRSLLRECLPIVSAEIMTWQIRGGEESRKRGQDLVIRINAALGESEEHPDMLKNADNFNTSGGNVKENNIW